MSEEELLGDILPLNAQQSAVIIRNPGEQIARTGVGVGTMFSETDLMPVRCYSCGEVIRQLAIEDRLRSGMSLRETLDDLDYPLICCRDLIRAQVPVLRIEREQANLRRLEEMPLTAITTGPAGMRQFEDPPLPQSEVTVVEPSEMLDYSGELIAESEVEDLLDEEPADDAYSRFAREVQEEEEPDFDD